MTNKFYGLFLGGCLTACSATMAPYPTTGVNQFYTNDQTLAKAATEGLQRWTDAGVIVMADVRVILNTPTRPNKVGLPILYSAAKDMEKNCNSPDPGPGKSIGACVSFNEDGDMIAIYANQDQPYDNMEANLMHEFVHAVVPLHEHNPEPGGVFSEIGFNDITQSDLDWICAHTACVED